MKFPFAYHSKKNNRLVCINIDDHYENTDIEVWDQLNGHWQQISPDIIYSNDAIINFQDKLSSNNY